jgi:hypothetical protein
VTVRLQLPHLEISFRKVLSSHFSSNLICHLQTHLPFSLLLWPPLTNSPSFSHYSSQQVLSSTCHQCAGYLTWLAPMFVFFKLSWLKIKVGHPVFGSEQFHFHNSLLGTSIAVVSHSSRVLQSLLCWSCLFTSWPTPLAEK